MKNSFCALALLLTLSGCGESDRYAATEETKAQIAAAKEVLSTEPRIRDVYHEELHYSDLWNIGIINKNATEHGYASYVCEVLNEYDFAGREQEVRIVDIKRVKFEGLTPRKASLIRLDCANRTVSPE